jgi:hypothetical protein
MDITIDTTHPLNDTDRAVLTALLGDAPAPVRALAAPHTPRPNSAAAAVAAIGAGMPNAAGRPTGVPASARGPVASQPGVSLTESVAESTPEERRADA